MFEKDFEISKNRELNNEIKQHSSRGSMPSAMRELADEFVLIQRIIKNKAIIPAIYS
jgi:hypothetical protein